jgi:hypothetical protein
MCQGRRSLRLGGEIVPPATPAEQVAKDQVYSIGVRIMQAAADAQMAKNIETLTKLGFFP